MAESGADARVDGSRSKNRGLSTKIDIGVAAVARPALSAIFRQILSERNFDLNGPIQINTPNHQATIP